MEAQAFISNIWTNIIHWSCGTYILNNARRYGVYPFMYDSHRTCGTQIELVIRRMYNVRVAITFLIFLYVRVVRSLYVLQVHYTSHKFIVSPTTALYILQLHFTSHKCIVRPKSALYVPHVQMYKLQCSKTKYS